MEPGQALFLLLLPTHERQKDTGLLASDMVMKAAECYHFWVFQQETRVQKAGGSGKNETDRPDRHAKA